MLNNRFLLWFLAWISISISLPVSGTGAALGHLGWSITSGEIVDSYVIGRRTRAGFVHWEEKIVYQYTVNGQTLTSDRVCLYCYKKALDLIANYPKGKAIKVYYKPNFPTHAILEPGHTQWLKQIFQNSVRGVILATLIGLPYEWIRRHRKNVEDK